VPLAGLLRFTHHHDGAWPVSLKAQCSAIDAAGVPEPFGYLVLCDGFGVLLGLFAVPDTPPSLRVSENPGLNSQTLPSARNRPVKQSTAGPYFDAMTLPVRVSVVTTLQFPIQQSCRAKC
jgi:hypothetical protein